MVETVEVGAPLTPVFEVFTRELADWWPQEYTFSDQRLAGASIEHLEGGAWFEVDVDGNRTDWGQVRVWEPPDRLVVSWRVGSQRTQEDPENASEVEVQFESLGASVTQVRVEHRDFEKHGAGAKELFDGMSSEQGWRRILADFSRSASWPGTQNPADIPHQPL